MSTNSKANIPANYRRTVRAMAHRLFMTGRFELIETIPDPNASGVLVPTKKDGTLDQLHGMLGHIDAVDRYNALLAAHAQGVDEVSVMQGISSKENLYRRFLMFKNFYVAATPVIVCEGKTDNVYIKHAIRNLAVSFPNLASSPGGKIALLVRILKYPGTSTGRILRLNGGTGDFIKFIPQYVREIAKFKAPGMQNPVILLVDNDEAGRKVLNVVRQYNHNKLTGKEPFVQIVGNLYLVMTPLKAGQTESVIEDAFGDQIKNLKLSGKSFHPDGWKTFNRAIHFGKHIFSQYVEKNASKMDFSGFAELFASLEAVIKAYKATIAQPAAQATP